MACSTKFNLPENLLDEASPGNWLGLQSQADWHSLVNDSSLCKSSYKSTFLISKSRLTESGLACINGYGYLNYSFGFYCSKWIKEYIAIIIIIFT